MKKFLALALLLSLGFVAGCEKKKDPPPAAAPADSTPADDAAKPADADPATP